MENCIFKIGQEVFVLNFGKAKITDIIKVKVENSICESEYLLGITDGEKSAFVFENLILCVDIQ